MKMESSTPQTQQQNLTYYHASLNDKAVIRKWRELKAQYAAYTDMVRELEDHYFGPRSFTSRLIDRSSARRLPRSFP